MITSEQERILQAINMAIEMELDGKECYLAASEGSTNVADRKLLQSLAEEEDNHLQTFEGIYNAIRQGRDWPHIDLGTDRAGSIRETLVKTYQVLGVSVGGTSSELDAVKVAIDKEKNSYDFYENQGSKAIYDTERSFYEALAREEREHELTLLDYYDYLSDPAAWFVTAEHPSLDGG
ncbi:MAG: ferritin family protein [Candidatus Hermodarchaeia archaeon]|jgi:rubrerythrin